MVPVLLGSAILIFFLLFVLPGDPAVFIAGGRGTEAQVELIRRSLGLDRPVPVQFVDWLWRTAHGDFGTSYINGFSVKVLLLQRLPVTAELALGAIVVATAIGLPAGLAGALWSEGPIGRLIDLFNAVAIAVPVFWLGILFQIYIGLQLGILPALGYVAFTDDPVENLRSMVLPSLTLGLGIAAVIARFLKAGILEGLRQNYVVTARAKGLSRRRVLFKHVLRNALMSVVTVTGLQFGGLLGGAVLTESVFNLPGLGNLMWISIQRRDYFVIQALTLLTVAVFLLVNLATDLTYGFIDPRIRTQEEQ